MLLEIKKACAFRSSWLSQCERNRRIVTRSSRGALHDAVRNVRSCEHQRAILRNAVLHEVAVLQVDLAPRGRKLVEVLDHELFFTPLGKNQCSHRKTIAGK